jgi:hypothetical protein
MIAQMVMAMLWRIPNDRRSMMRFMPIDRCENGVGVMVRATAGMGASGNGKCHTDAQHPKRQLAHERCSPSANIRRLGLGVSVTSHNRHPLGVLELGQSKIQIRTKTWELGHHPKGDGGLFDSCEDTFRVLTHWTFKGA